MPDFSAYRPSRSRSSLSRIPGYQGQQQDGFSPLQVNMLRAQAGREQHAAIHSQPQVPGSSRGQQQSGVFEAGEKVHHIQRPDGAYIPVAAATGDAFLIRPKGGSTLFSPKSGEEFGADPASPVGISSVTKARLAAEAAKQAAAAQKEATKAEAVQAKEVTAQAKEATKQAEAAVKLENARKTDQFLKEGRTYNISRETGAPMPKQSDEEWQAAKAAKMAELQQKAAAKPFKDELKKLKLDLDDPDVLPKVTQKDLEDRQAKANAAAAAIKAVRANSDYESDLTDEEVQAALADSTLRGPAAEYIQTRKELEELPKQIKAREAAERRARQLNRRIEDPEGYKAGLQKEVRTAAPEELRKNADAIEAQAKQRQQEFSENKAALDKADADLAAQHDHAQKQYEDAKNSGDPRILGMAGDALAEIEQQMQQHIDDSEERRISLSAEEQEINRDVEHLGIVAGEINKRREASIEAQAGQLDKALPGAGARYNAIITDAQKRADALKAKYPDPEAPEAKAAFEAFQKDVQGKVEGIQKEAHAKATERADDLRAARVAIERDGFEADTATSMKKSGLDPKNPKHKDAYFDANKLINLEQPDKSSWEPGDNIRKGSGSATLSDGSLHVNPQYFHDPLKYAKVVEASEASDEEKAKAIADLPRLQLAFAESVLPMLKQAGSTKAAQWIPGIASFQKWQAETKPTGSEAEQASQYLAEMNARGAWSKGTDNVLRSLLAGFADIGTMAAGTVGLLSSSQTVSEAAADWSKRSSDFMAPVSLEGGDSGLGSAILGQTARMAGPMAATLLVTRGLGGGMATMSALSAAQTAGSQYADSYGQLREQGMKHGEAWKQTAPYALASGMVTAMLTAAGGRTGFEAALGTKAGQKAAKEAAQGFWRNLTRNVPKQALAEIPEELPDELFSQISQALATDPNADVPAIIGKFWEDSPAFLGSIALMGGAGGVMETRQQFPKGGKQELPTDLDGGPDAPTGPLPEDLAGATAAVEAWTPDLSVPLPGAVEYGANARKGAGKITDEHRIESAKDAANALVMVANGTDPRQLSSPLLLALGFKPKPDPKTGDVIPANNTLPLVDMVKGKDGKLHPVITDKAREWLNKQVPGAGSAIKQSEAERVEQIKNPPKPAKKAVEKQPKGAKMEPSEVAPSGVASVVPEAVPEASPSSLASEGAVEGDRTASIDRAYTNRGTTKADVYTAAQASPAEYEAAAKRHDDEWYKTHKPNQTPPLAPSQRNHIKEAIGDNQPVNAEAFDSLERPLKMPDGWVKRDGMYHPPATTPVDQAAHTAATSPKNDLPQPAAKNGTEAATRLTAVTTKSGATVDFSDIAFETRIQEDPATYGAKPPEAKTVAGKAKVLDFAGRKIVHAVINGVKVPFYLSTGRAGKKNVQAGKWYPVFGFASDGWLNKGSQEQINNYYGSPELREVAEHLDNVLGDMISADVQRIGIKGPQHAALNEGLSPTDNGEPLTKKRLDANIAATIARIEAGRKKPQSSAPSDVPRGTTEEQPKIPQASPDRQAKVDSLRAQGGDVVVVQDDAAAEALIGAPLVNKGRRGLTTRVNGKPTVVLIQSNMAGDSRGVDALLDEELHHAATMMVMDEAPDLAAAAEQEAAGMKGDAIHSDFGKLSNRGKVVEAAAAYASGKWKPGKKSKIKAMVDAVVNRIAKALNITTKEAKPLAIDAIRRIAAEADAKIAPKTEQPLEKQGETTPATGGKLIEQANNKADQVIKSLAFDKDKKHAAAAKTALIAQLRRYNGKIPLREASITGHGAAQLAPDGTVEIDTAKLLEHAAKLKSPKAAEKYIVAMFRHEIIHLAAIRTMDAPKVLALWKKLPAQVQADTLRAYNVALENVGQGAVTMADFQNGHEFIRALVEADVVKMLSEQVIDTSLKQELLQFLADFLEALRNLAKTIKDPAVRADVEAARDTVKASYLALEAAIDAELAAKKSPQTAEKAAKTPKSSTQLTLSLKQAAPILDFHKSIPKGELYDSIDPEWSDGALETEPHVTVLFGLTKHEAAPVAKAIKDHGPITVTLGKLSIFENDQYDVLKVDIESPELRALNAKLTKLPHESSFPDYKPHMTIAYLKKGEGKKYVGDTRFEGRKFTFDTMTFSPPPELRGDIGKPELPLSKSIGDGAENQVATPETNATPESTSGKPAGGSSPAVAPQESIKSANESSLKNESGGFDSTAWNANREDNITASKKAGNIHLDQVYLAVENSRGREIYNVHDPKERGVIRTVANTGDVVVNWSDSYSAEKNLATAKKERVGKKEVTVYQTWLMPSDLKDYVFVSPPVGNRKPTITKPQSDTKADIPAPETAATVGETAPAEMDTPPAKDAIDDALGAAFEGLSSPPQPDYAAFEAQLESQQTLDLEDDQVSIPQFNAKKDSLVESPLIDDVHLMVRNRDEVAAFGPHEFFFNDDNDNVVGFARLTKSPKEVSINLIYVDPDRQGQGIGSAFYKYWLDQGISVKSDKEITDATAELYKSLVRQGYGYAIEGNRAVLTSNASLSANPQPVEQVAFPKDRREVMMKAASTVIDLGLKTPQELAARLDKLRPDGALRKYARAFWRVMTGFDESLEEAPDWNAVFAGIDQTQGESKRDWTSLSDEELPPLDSDMMGYRWWRSEVASKALPNGSEIEKAALALELADAISEANNDPNLEGWQHAIVAKRVAAQMLVGERDDIFAKAKTRALADEYSRWFMGGMFDGGSVSEAAYDANSAGRPLPEGFERKNGMIQPTPASAKESDTPPAPAESNAPVTVTAEMVSKWFRAYYGGNAEVTKVLPGLFKIGDSLYGLYSISKLTDQQVLNGVPFGDSQMLVKEDDDAEMENAQSPVSELWADVSRFFASFPSDSTRSAAINDLKNGTASDDGNGYLIDALDSPNWKGVAKGIAPKLIERIKATMEARGRDGAPLEVSNDTTPTPTIIPERGDTVTWTDGAGKPATATVDKITARDGTQYAWLEWFGTKEVPLDQLTVKTKSGARLAREKREAEAAKIPAKEVTAPEKAKEKKPADTKALRAMKTYLLEKLDDAIAAAPSEAALADVRKDLVELMGLSDKSTTPNVNIAMAKLREKYNLDPKAKKADIDAAIRASVPAENKVVIEIPGDGTFTLWNDKKTLQNFAKVAKSFPTTTPTADAPTLNPIRPSGIPTLKSGKASKSDIVKVAGMFTSTDETRQALMQVADFGDVLVATNGKMLFTAPFEGFGSAEDPMLYTAKGGQIGLQSKVGDKFEKFPPQWKAVVPVDLPTIHKGIDTGRLWQILKQASSIARDVNFKVKNGKGQTEDVTPYVAITINQDGSLGVKSQVSNNGLVETYAHNIQEGGDPVGTFDAELFMDALAGFRALGHEKVAIKSGTERGEGPIMLTSPDAEVVIMRVKTQAVEPTMPERDTKVESAAPIAAEDTPQATPLKTQADTALAGKTPQELLAMAAPYEQQGPDYNRNIAESAARMRRALEMDAKFWQLNADELAIRLEKWAAPSETVTPPPAANTDKGLYADASRFFASMNSDYKRSQALASLKSGEIAPEQIEYLANVVEGVAKVKGGTARDVAPDLIARLRAFGNPDSFAPGQRVSGKKEGDFNRAGIIDSSGPTTDGERTWFVQTDTVGSVVYKESELTAEQPASAEMAAEPATPAVEETAPEVASIKSTRKPRAPKKPTLFERLQAYFVPGAIVDSYGGKDRVVALHPDGGIGQGGWSVEVVSVDKDGKDTPGARVRRHSTLPSEKELQKAWENRPDASPLQSPPTASARPIASVIRSFEAAFPTFAAYMNDNAGKPARKKALTAMLDVLATDPEARGIFEEFAALNPDKLLFDDIERVKEAGEILPTLGEMSLGANPTPSAAKSRIPPEERLTEKMLAWAQDDWKQRNSLAADIRAIQLTRNPHLTAQQWAEQVLARMADRAQDGNLQEWELEPERLHPIYRADWKNLADEFRPAALDLSEKIKQVVAGRIQPRGDTSYLLHQQRGAHATQAGKLDAQAGESAIQGPEEEWNAHGKPQKTRFVATNDARGLRRVAATREILEKFIENQGYSADEWIIEPETGMVAEPERSQSITDMAAKAAAIVKGEQPANVPQSIRRGLFTLPEVNKDERIAMKGKGAAVFFQPTAKPVTFGTMELRNAFQKAASGKSSAVLSIREVFNAAKERNPGLNAPAFMAQVKADYYNGLVGLEPPEQASTVEAAGPFKLRDSMGIESTSMSFLPTTEAEMIDAAERDERTPDDILQDWANTPLQSNPQPAIDPTVANQGTTPGNREVFAQQRGRYIAEELEQADFDAIRKAVGEQVDADEQGMLDNILYKVENDELLTLEEEVGRRILADRLRTRGTMEDDANLIRMATRLWGQDIASGTDTARKLAMRVDQFESPQERLNAAIGRILAPNLSRARERLSNTWTPSAKRREIARLEADIAEANGNTAKERLKRVLDAAQARLDRDQVIQQMADENEKKVNAILSRIGLSQSDLHLTPDDRHSMQMAVMEMPHVKRHMEAQTDSTRKAIEMSVRGYADDAIVEATGMPLRQVEQVTEDFRTNIAKQAISQEIKVGKQTFGGIIEAGKNLLKWILKAPPQPLGRMVAAGTVNAAHIQNQILRILNATIPTRRQRNRRTLHAKKVNNSAKKNRGIADLEHKLATTTGDAAYKQKLQDQIDDLKAQATQKITIFVPYDPTDWQQVYRVARELSMRDATAFDKGYEYWINGILSGPQTHVVNTASNLLSSAWHYGPQWFASATVNSLGIRDPRSTQWGEFRHLWGGFIKGAMPALQNFALAWNTEADPVEYQYLDKPVTVMFENGRLDKIGGRGPSIGGTPGRVIRTPGRFLVAADAFAKTIIMHAEVAAHAFRLGKQQKLHGASLTSFIEGEVKKHGSESWEAAYQTATELTFQDENEITKGIEKIVNAGKMNKVTGLLFKFTFPFVRTPTNIYRAGIRKAGGSAGVMMWRLAKGGFYKMKDGTPFFDSYSKGKMVKDVSESIMAGIIWMGLMSFGAGEGDEDDDKSWLTITGSRPYGVANAGERASQLRQEGGSNLIIIRLFGKVFRIPYGRYEPLALTVGTLADAVREFKEMSRMAPGDQGADKLAGEIMKHVVAQAQDKTFLQGISAWSQLVEDIATNRLEIGTSVAKQFVNGIIPNFVRQPLRLFPEIMGDSKKANEVFGIKTLGAALSDAEPKINEAGQPVRRTASGLVSTLFPVATEPSAALFDNFLKNWNTKKPSEMWNPDTMTKGDWFVYDPAKGSDKGKVPLTTSKAITRFESMVGTTFASMAAKELIKLGYRPGGTVTPAMLAAVQEARKKAIKITRKIPPSIFSK